MNLLQYRFEKYGNIFSDYKTNVKFELKIRKYKIQTNIEHKYHKIYI